MSNEKHGGENFSVHGDAAESQLSGVVSGETGGSENAQKHERLQEINETLSAMEQKVAVYDDLVRIFEDASGLPERERLETVINGLNARAHELSDNNDVDAASERRRISLVVNRLRELL